MVGVNTIHSVINRAARGWRVAGCLFLAAAGHVLHAQDGGASLTLYNQHFGVVRERVMLDLSPGESRIAFSDITAHLEPETVILRDPAGRADIRILEQNYRNDPVSQDLLLRHFEGQEIEFERMIDGKVQLVKGRIIRAPYSVNHDAARRFGGAYATHQMAMGHGAAGVPIIEVGGLMRFSLPGMPLFPGLADDSIMKPTLHWTLAAGAGHKGELELAYLSRGFAWQADYNLVLDGEGDGGGMTGWVTMENHSGRTFVNARIRLMAGDVARVARQQDGLDRSQRMFRMAEAAQEPTVTQESFDEYHLYTLARRTTLRDRETKQVEFVHAPKVRAERVYIYNGAGLRDDFWRYWRPENTRDDQSFGIQSNSKVWVYREIRNDEGNNLGMPLPKGLVRFYRQGAEDSLEFVGESSIDHTPRNETLRLYTGDAFDLVGERRQTDYQRDTGRRTVVESFEIKVRNRKQSEAVSVRVIEPMYRGYTWEITAASMEHEKVDSRTTRFDVTLEPDEEKTLTYTVRYTW